MIGKPLDQIRFDDIENFVAVDKLEITTVEVKQDFSNPEKIVRAITQFANTWGGVVLIGIEEKQGSQPCYTAKGVPYDAKDRERIENMVVTTTRPPVRMEMQPVTKPTDEKTCVWVIQVQESLEAPHELYEGGKPTFVGRYGGRTTGLDLDRIERLLARRDATRSLRPAYRVPAGGVPANSFELFVAPCSPRAAAFLRPKEEEAIWVHLLGKASLIPTGCTPMRTRNALAWRHVTPRRSLEITIEGTGKLVMKETDEAEYGQELSPRLLLHRSCQFLMAYGEILRVFRHAAQSEFWCRIGAPASNKSPSQMPPPVVRKLHLKDFAEIILPDNPFPDMPSSSGVSGEQCVGPLTLPYDVLQSNPAALITDMATMIFRDLGTLVNPDTLLKFVSGTFANWKRK